ncbi:MAG: homoserine kinase [Rhodospirillaceae bacterium]
MSVFTTVTHDELSAWLRGYALGTLVDLKGIAAGIENTNYFVTTTAGRYVLTLFEKLQAHELPFYLDLMAHLADAGIPCPHPIADRSGRYLGELKGKPASIVTLLKGRDIEQPDETHCAQVGELLAHIHIAGATYAGRMDNPRGRSWWAGVMSEILPFLDDQDSRLLQSEIDHQAKAWPAGLPHGAIHADLFRDNVLFEHGRLTGVIDFYFACTGEWVYDLAITVNDWCYAAAGALDEQRTRALVKAYARVRPFAPEEYAAWPTMLRAAALRFWVSRLYDFHLPRPGALTHAKDPAHFREILRRHIAQAGELPRVES